MNGGDNFQSISRRVRACDYLAVAQLFLQNNFLLEKPLSADDIKPRLLGHWGTCHGINVAYANLKAHRPDTTFILGPGHGFPALQANLFIDGELEKVDPRATRDAKGIAYLCRNFSWPGGFPSHSSPFTPGVICEGGELGYALGAAYGLALGHPERHITVLLGDGEFETATALASLNLSQLVGDHHYNGHVMPILHLNGYKISAPTVYGRKSEREMNELIRGFGYQPLWVDGDAPCAFQAALKDSKRVEHPFLIFRSEKGATGPKTLDGKKVAGNYLAHQIPLPDVKTDPDQLKLLSAWLKSYDFSELFKPEKGFTL